MSWVGPGSIHKDPNANDLFCVCSRRATGKRTETNNTAPGKQKRSEGASRARKEELDQSKIGLASLIAARHGCWLWLPCPQFCLPLMVCPKQ